jgi:DnaJ homolog subfamily C member 7
MFYYFLVFLFQEAGNEAFYAGQYTEAIEHYSAAIACCTESRFFTAVCLCNRASAHQALGQIVDAIADCSLAIALDPTNTKVFILKQQIVNMLVQLDGLIRSLFY